MSHHSNNQIASGLDFYSTKPDLSSLKNHKIIYEYETAWSPTSSLDFRVFSNLGNPFGGSSSSSKSGNQKSWDSGKVGLSIVDSLDDSSRVLLPSSDSKNIIFGSKMRTQNPKCQKLNLPNHVVEGFLWSSQPPMEKEDNPNVDSIELDNSYCSGKENISVNNNACQVLLKPLNSDIKISEEYTCVTSHGPNPKTTHLYGDQVLASVEGNSLKKDCCRNKKESIFEIVPFELTPPIDVLLPSNDFLSFCCSCNKKLDLKKDIYMYRGYKAFCSNECRSNEIQPDEKMEEEEEEEEEEEAVMSDSSSE